jgi:protein required for attachment to host cells
MQKSSGNQHPSREVIGITWVVVADAAKAYIYSRPTRRGSLELVQVFSEPAARSAEHDLVSDSPGRTFDSLGSARHAKQPEHTAKQNLRTSFARQIADFIESGRTANRFADLVIVAAPALLGELRTHFDAPLLQIIRAEIPKHMTAATPAEITAAIAAV